MEHQRSHTVSSDQLKNVNLVELRKKVAELSSKYAMPTTLETKHHPTSATTSEKQDTPPSAIPSLEQQDSFANQLADIMQRLRGMERRMSEQKVFVDQQTKPPSPPSLPSNITPATDGTARDLARKGSTAHKPGDSCCHELGCHSRHVQHNMERQILLLAGYIDGMRKEVKDSLVEVEQKMEDKLEALDDRLDGFDPNRFTPASSNAGIWTGWLDQQSGYEQQHEAPSPLTQRVLPPLCELQSDQQPSNDLHLAPRLSVSSGVSRDYENPSAAPASWTAPCTFIDSVAAQHEYNLRSDIDRLASEIGVLSQRNIALDTENERLTMLMARMMCGTAPSPRPQEAIRPELPAQSSQTFTHPEDCDHISPGGVDFRDREISRLDEQLKIANDKLKASEDNLADRDIHIHKLTADLQNVEEKLEVQTASHRHKLDQLDGEIMELHYQLTNQKRFAEQWHDNACHWRSESMKAYQQNARAEEERLEREKLFDDERSKFNDFCAQKDRVIEMQAESIAKAKRLLEQSNEELADKDTLYQAREQEWKRTRAGLGRTLERKDLELAALRKDFFVQSRRSQRGGEEIAELKRRVRVVEDDREHAVRNAERLGRLLEERDRELNALKSEMLQREKRDVDELVSVTEAVPESLPGSPMPAATRRPRFTQRADGAFDDNGSGSGTDLPLVDRIREILPDEPRTDASVRATRGSPTPPPPKKSKKSKKTKGKWKVRDAYASRGQYPEPDRRGEEWSSRQARAGAVFERPVFSPGPSESDMPSFDREWEELPPSPPSPQQWRGAVEEYPVVRVVRSPTPEAMPPPQYTDAGDRRPLWQEILASAAASAERSGFRPPYTNASPVGQTRRMASEADLRHTGLAREDGQNSRLAKHRSMMELPRRELQPYVEDYESVWDGEE